jgi:hypothetical protein
VYGLLISIEHKVHREARSRSQRFGFNLEQQLAFTLMLNLIYMMPCALGGLLLYTNGSYTGYRI